MPPLRVDPRAFRRAVHAFGATFVVYYLLPTRVPAVAAFVTWGPPLIVLAAIALEALRVRGAFASEALFGLREYERRRVGSYVYFGVVALLLLTLTPQTVAVPCLVGVALLDPVHALLREARGLGTWGAFVTGFPLATALFLLAGWAPPFALLAGLAMAVGEVARVPFVDDDFLMGALPAAVLVGALALGLADAPPPFLFPLDGGPLP